MKPTTTQAAAHARRTLETIKAGHHAAQIQIVSETGASLWLNIDGDTAGEIIRHIRRLNTEHHKAQTQRTNTKAFRAAFRQYLADSVTDPEETTTARRCKELTEYYYSEFCYPANIQRYPYPVLRLAEYLQGLPLSVAYHSGPGPLGIESHARALKVWPATESQRARLTENWFVFIANHAIKALQEIGLDLTATNVEAATRNFNPEAAA